MKKNVSFHSQAFEDYIYWQETDSDIFKKIAVIKKKNIFAIAPLSKF